MTVSTMRSGFAMTAQAPAKHISIVQASHLLMVAAATSNKQSKPRGFSGQKAAWNPEC